MIRRALLAVLVAAAVSALPAPPAEAQVRTAGQLLDWIAQHPRNAGLVALRPASGKVVLAQSAGRRFPLASVRKVLVLGAYAEAVAAGRADPAARVATADVDRWYWPGTDAGAHSAAVKEWRAQGLVQAGTVPLDAVARAAVRWSDNAAADYLLVRFGRRAVERFARRQGLPRQHPMPFFGEFLAWTERSPAAWRALSPARRARVAWHLAAATTPGEAAQRKLPGVRALRRLVAASSAGTPRAWARLMGRLGTAGGAVVRRHLEWPLELPANRAFVRFGTKGGSLPGVVNEASYLRPRGAAMLAVTVFLRDLPPAVERSLARSFAQQRLIVRLATDPRLLARAQSVLH